MQGPFDGLEKAISTVRNIPSRISNWLRSVSWETQTQSQNFKDIKSLTDLNAQYKIAYNTPNVNLNELNKEYYMKRHIIAKNFVIALQDIKADMINYARQGNKAMLKEIFKDFDSLLKQFKVYKTYAGTDIMKTPEKLATQLIAAYQKEMNDALTKYNTLQSNQQPKQEQPKEEPKQEQPKETDSFLTQTNKIKIKLKSKS
jgi:maltooligosyltrehalose synthase